ncbi:hypothetical protein WBJ53_04635 [Spirosoma sp. SC4-14]|uniref:hypothetical protein n=1 Tax=Spirosoma sp. SC4-14 TaxID=3128900 RepID=UPI0030CEA73C
MKTRTTGLTAQELARYLGGRVQVLAEGNDVQSRNAKLVAVDILNEEAKVCYDGSRIEYSLSSEFIRPVLRKLVTINNEEASECFKTAYSWEEDIDVVVTRGNDYIELYADPITLIITAKGVIASSKDSGYRVGPARVNARAILNYLDAQSFDLDGLIESGFAIDDEILTD